VKPHCSCGHDFVERITTGLGGSELFWNVCLCCDTFYVYAPCRLRRKD
jgi:hypothetical protein